MHFLKNLVFQIDYSLGQGKTSINRILKLTILGFENEKTDKEMIKHIDLKLTVKKEDYDF